MGPFVPDMITDEMNLIVALFLGIAFGAVLEQAGFSSSRRLAGVFYGYDFTVLRVFFTAGVTAMIGVVLLGDYGLLDTGIIYVNPTFLGPAIVGGAIMGVGFVLGGYCPGTSVAAAAIGKKDGIAFVFGGLLGVLLFGELFPLYSDFYVSGSLGPLKVSGPLGMSQGTFVLVMTLAAVVAFTLTTRIERKVNPASETRAWRLWPHALAATALIGLAAYSMILPDWKESLLRGIESQKFQQDHPIPVMTADELAFRILDSDPRLVIVDVRTPEEFARMSLPGSVNVPLEGLPGKEYAAVLGLRHMQRVFVDSTGSLARKAALLATRLGYENVRMLDGGLSAFRTAILEFKPPDGVPSPGDADTYRFRAVAGVQLTKMIEQNRNQAQKPKAPVKKIAGGC